MTDKPIQPASPETRALYVEVTDDGLIYRTQEKPHAPPE